MKTILIIDDEQVFLEALNDALLYEGYRVLKASNATEAVRIIQSEVVDLATVDIMMPPGASFGSGHSSHTTGVELCEYFRTHYPEIDLFCISVVSDPTTISSVERLGAKFLRKGETPLRTVLALIKSRLSGVAYDSSRRRVGE